MSQPNTQIEALVVRRADFHVLTDAQRKSMTVTLTNMDCIACAERVIVLEDGPAALIILTVPRYPDKFITGITCDRCAKLADSVLARKTVANFFCVPEANASIISVPENEVN
jgi:hypothetical protein